jgi:hypothetical protein
MAFMLESGSATDYEIRVYDHRIWPTKLTTWYAEYTLGEVKEGIEIQVQVCGSETLTAQA